MSQLTKYVVVIGAMLALVAAVACSDGDGVSQSDYDALKSELDSTKAALDAAQSGAAASGDTVSKAEYDALQRELDAAKAAGSTGGEAMSGQRLQAVKDRGKVVCASNNSLAAFGYVDAGGNTTGFDIDLCRAVAAAVLGNADAVEYRPTVAAERGPTMQSGEVDMMSRNTTWTTSRDATWGDFAQTMFYDGQGFMVPKSLGLSGMLDLDGAKVCVQQGTTTELNLQDFINQNNLDIDVVTFPDNVSTNEAYLSGQCDALTTDRSGLVSTRAGFEKPDDHVILAGTISEEPLGPVVPHGDDQWYDIVKAVMAMLIYAEAFEITSDSVPTSATGSTAVDRLFGLGGSYGQEEMGLSETVAQDVIRAVGNYGEIYDRHLTPVGLTREGSRNALWNAAPCTDCPKGGQVYAAPLR